MKSIIKITVLAVTVTFLSAMVVTAQEHNHKHKSEKVQNNNQSMDIKNIDTNNDGIDYECPMKCETPSDKPGKCSKCGMDLKKVTVKNGNSKKMNHDELHKKNQDSVVYECPMKCESPSDKPGKCSKCGMDLKKVTVKQAKINQHNHDSKSK